MEKLTVPSEKKYLLYMYSTDQLLLPGYSIGLILLFKILTNTAYFASFHQPS